MSQFTLYADTRKGRRPSWQDAAPGEVAEPLVDEVVAELRRRGCAVATGVFGAPHAGLLGQRGPDDPAAGGLSRPCAFGG